MSTKKMYAIKTNNFYYDNMKVRDFYFSESLSWPGDFQQNANTVYPPRHLNFQRSVISCFQVEIWLKDRYIDVNSQNIQRTNYFILKIV